MDEIEHLTKDLGIEYILFRDPMFSLRQKRVIEICNDHVLGRIYIEDGHIIHAAGGELTGERALQRLLSLPGSSFELIPFETPPERTMTAPWEMLIAEATRKVEPGVPRLDGVEVVASHGYLPAQFLNPRVNLREDQERQNNVGEQEPVGVLRTESQGAPSRRWLAQERNRSPISSRRASHSSEVIA